MSIKVSVIVPVFNVEKQLPRCLDSLLAQTYNNLEIILVDDGSTDSSKAICDDYAAKDSRIKVLHKSNGGVSSARNAAIPHATGEYLLFLDGDDSLDFCTIEEGIKYAQNNTLDIVNYGYHHYLEKRSGELVFIRDDSRKQIRMNTQKEIVDNFTFLFENNLIDFVTDKLIRTACVRDNNISFNSYFNMGGEDGVFMLDLLPYLQSFYSVERCFYNYYHREGESVTKIFKEGKFDRYYERIKKIEKFMREHDCMDYDFLFDTYFSNILWTYESMFSDTCKLSFKERCRFLKSVFYKPELFSNFNNEAILRLKKSKVLMGYSNGSRKALEYILKKKHNRLCLLHKLQLIKIKLAGKRN